ncbi:hypothetical protein DFJ73DRAFT_957413 [Zopfochytrium polystomum]|nr:hypothetical protein DFJ73DRAFT_957413 [Zopfochytrium polystomum]
MCVSALATIPFAAAARRALPQLHPTAAATSSSSLASRPAALRKANDSIGPSGIGCTSARADLTSPSLFHSGARARQQQSRPPRAPAPRREYFYHIDIHGYLYLHDTVPKNFVTSFKDLRFLDFFFSRLQLNDSGRHPEYKYLSPCGPEFNYVQSEDAPIVFTDLRQAGNGSHTLTWAGNLTVPFDPASLHVSARTGRLFHPAPPSHPLFPPWALTAQQQQHEGVPPLGLIRSALVQAALVDGLAEGEDGRSWVWGGVTYPITQCDI